MLARINWIFFSSDSMFESSMESLLSSMSETMTNYRAPMDPQTVSDSGAVNFHGMNFNINLNKYTGNEKDNELSKEGTQPHQPVSRTQSQTMGMKYDFWDRNFGSKTEVSWVDFKKQFELDYREKIVSLYSEDRFKLFINLIYKDIFTLEKTIKKSQYDLFCEGNPNADMHRFYNRLQDYAIGYHAMVEVFSMSSSLRLTTIQNLGKFSFPAVVQGLTKMLKDADPNIRAVATIALAKSAKNRKTTVDRILSQLDDEDRLVRESACLALGLMKPGVKAEEAVAEKWRNDPIKSVREAAEIALKRMGGEVASKCIQVTNILAKEMDFLKQPMS